MIPPARAARTPRAGGHWPVRIVLAFGGLAVCGIWWLDPASTTLTTPGDVLTGAGRVAGLVGAYLVLVQLLLLARLPWLERAIGFDRLVAWHRGLGTNVVLVLVAHVLLVVVGLAMSEHNAPWSALWEVLTTYPDTPLALAGLAIFGVVAISGAQFVRRRLSYEAWYLLHLGTYLAVALAFFHQISSGADFVTNSKARTVWVLLYVVVAGAVLWWRVIRPVRGWLRHAITVDRVVRETAESVSVWLRGRDLAALNARPGQFLLWRFITVEHLWTAHPYSLSAPVRDDRMRITVKGGGNHSAALTRLRRGVPVLVEGPFGHFTAGSRRMHPVLLISGGSGIAPIRALAEDLLDERADVVLVHRASTWNDVPLRAELDAMAEYGPRVHYVIGRRAELRYDPLAPGPSLGGSTAPGTTPAPSGRRTVDGSVVDTPYGPVQVSVVFDNGRIVDVRAIQTPTDQDRSVRLASLATPILRQEVLSAQSARIDTVSGATYTSEGYAESVQYAIDHQR